MQTVRSLVLISCLASIGCASTPDAIRDAPDGPSLSDVLVQPEDFVGERVRWGGTIASVENAADNTRVFLVARELFESGRPRDTDTSAGRFIAVLPGFHDPAVLAKGRQLTAVGVLSESTISAIGDYEYRYPVMQAEIHRLWPKRVRRDYRKPPFHPHYYDPWHYHDYFGRGHYH